MKKAISVLGVVLAYLTGLYIFFVGLLVMYQVWGLAGLLIGLFVAPIGLIAGLFTFLFGSIISFLCAFIWVSLLVLMINLGANE